VVVREKDSPLVGAVPRAFIDNKGPAAEAHGHACKSGA
jgi:hypothetical protein